MTNQEGDPTGNFKKAGFRAKALEGAGNFVKNKWVIGVTAASVAVGGGYLTINRVMADGPMAVRGIARNVITQEPEIIAFRDKTCAIEVGCPTDHNFVIQPENKIAVIEVCKDLGDQIMVCDEKEYPVTSDGAQIVAGNIGKTVELSEKDLTLIKPIELHRR